MKSKRRKRLCWIKPRLEYLVVNQTTKGDCTNGSGDRGLCMPVGSSAGSSCSIGDGFVF